MTSQDVSSNRRWVEVEFAGVSLGHCLRDARLREAATAIADMPSASNPHRLDWNELRGFYRIVNDSHATLENLQSGHRQQTQARMTAAPHRVLVIHDTTELDFTDHPAVHDQLGPIGTGTSVGLLQHNSLAFDPDAKQVLGLIYQQLECRQLRPKDETRQQRALRPDKESRLWLTGIRGVGRPPQGSRWIDVCDRGADFFEAMQESRHQGHEFLIRIHHDRRVRVPEVDEATGVVTDQLQSLHETMATMAAVATKVVSVASKGGRPAREASVQVGYCAVRLQPPQPDGFRRGLLPQSVTLIRVWEAGVVAARAAASEAKALSEQLRKEVKAAEAVVASSRRGKARTAAEADLSRLQSCWNEAKEIAKEKTHQVAEYLDWWLATSSPIESIEATLQAVSDYEWRWPVAEEYHKVEKTGLRIEGQRFETLAGLTAALSIMAVVAIRILQLRYARDEQPEAAADTVATREEIEMAGKATKATGPPLTVKQFVDRVARLGGYLGRKCDGPPGWMSLWRGYQRLTDMLLGQRLAQCRVETASTHHNPA